MQLVFTSADVVYVLEIPAALSLHTGILISSVLNFYFTLNKPGGGTLFF